MATLSLYMQIDLRVGEKKAGSYLMILPLLLLYFICGYKVLLLVSSQYGISNLHLKA